MKKVVFKTPVAGPRLEFWAFREGDAVFHISYENFRCSNVDKP
jgi:hypothetical protein